MSARLSLLLVNGNWWQRPIPGLLLCSPAADADDDQLYELLRETFASTLR